MRRAKDLEARLGAVSIYGASGPGGLFTERPGRDIRVFGLALAGHERGLAIVYGAALAGWSYLVSWGALRALDVGSPQKIGGIIGVVDRRSRPSRAPADRRALRLRESGWRESNPHSQLGRLELYH